MVQTEWKVARASKNVEKLYHDEAKNQINLYSAGVLGGVELVNTRYIVIVTDEDYMERVADIEENSVTYRFVNIPVDPGAPSKAARKRPRS